MKTNTCKQVIENRKSVRAYTSKEIETSDILDILDCARLAPSSKNYQPWRYFILSGTEKDEVSDMIIAKLKENNSENTGIATAKIIKNANKLILVFADRETLQAKDSGMYSMMLSMGASIQNALLRATELEIGSLWMYDINVIAEALEEKYNPSGMLVSGICLGEESGNLPRAKKKTLKEIILNKNI